MSNVSKEKSDLPEISDSTQARLESASSDFQTHQTLDALHLSTLKLSSENLLNLADSNFDLPPGLKFEPFVGTDIEDIERWQKLLPQLDSDLGKRIFFPEEHEYCRSYTDKAPRYAGRWCAKEAVFKALSSRYKLLTTDLKILCDSEERPYVDLTHARFAEAKPIIRLSITHSDTTALAFALALVPAP